MIALLFAGGAFAQETPPAEPAPTEEPAPPVPPPAEPEPEQPLALPVAEPTEPVPAPMPEPTPWVEVEDPGPQDRGYTRFGMFLEVGSIGNDDPAYDLFADGDSMGSAGVALSLNLAAHVAVVGSWHHLRHGATVTVSGADQGGTDTDADFQSDAEEFRSAMISNEGALGLRVNAGFMDLVYPYLSAQGLLFGARLRLDDDPEANDNPGQIQANGLTGGVMGTAGVEIRLPPNSEVQVAWTLEFGHGWLARTSFQEFGTMQPGGFVARSGIGLRF